MRDDYRESYMPVKEKIKVTKTKGGIMNKEKGFGWDAGELTLILLAMLGTCVAYDIMKYAYIVVRAASIAAMN